MSLRTPVIALVLTLALTTACTNKKVSNPLAKVDSKQPDKVLFDRGMDAMKHNHFDVARITMQTLIATYPDSEFVARAKLALADSWYAEGGSAGLAQAKQEYQDFQTFFPNMPEAAEAQLKIANIDFGEMEKPDRDFTHAVQAEQEYRQVIQQYPENQKVVAEAKLKLMEVQEVIAEREFRVGRFYYLRGSYMAAVARLQSLADRYPLYSKADEALFLIGQSYENQIAFVRRPEIEAKQKRFSEAQRKGLALEKEKYSSEWAAKASVAYSRILTRYPVMQRADEAKARFIALNHNQPVPRPTKAMLAQNKAEEASRRERSTMSTVMAAFGRHPDVTPASRVGEPSLEEQDLISAKTLLQETNRAVAAGGPDNKVVGVVKSDGGTTPSQPAPRSDDPASQPAADATPQNGTPATEQTPDPNELTPVAKAGGGPQAAEPDPNELTPNVPQDSKPAQAPAQVNELAHPDEGAKGGGAAASASNGSGQDLATEEQIASSKHKKKKGILQKIVPGK
jgi:outer membrane protein assembly factor BamD